jgi:diguanylate cyclase (GGDEF)-like protein
MWTSLKDDGHWQGEIWNRRKNGEHYTEWLSIAAVHDAEGTVTHYVGSFYDLTESKAAQVEIGRLIYLDSLTQLPNRRMLQEKIAHALASSLRGAGYGAILFIDLDNFKLINDTRGHDFGDLLLIEVAKRLRNAVREGDSVARLGGDEFVVLLEGLDKDKVAAAIQAKVAGEKILNILAQSYTLSNYEFNCTASIGLSLYGDGETITDLLQQADIAMYQSKKSGRNALRFFDPDMQAVVIARAALEEDLRNALEQNQLELYYQVQINTQRQFVGAEALLRWRHPVRGLVSPLEFIPLAEETGLILPIGLWVLKTACTQLKAWSGNTHTRELQLSINVSARQFHQVDFVARVLDELDQYQINPKLIKLELTESIVLDNVAETIANMNALRDKGVRFSMDDFGTGFSSLAYLTQLPLAQLKIDQSFVNNIGVKTADAVIVKIIIDMAVSLDMEVIAEGVETEEQRDFLKAHGCHLFQGYLFSKPVPIEEFEVLLTHA